jgi:hypothetical protein
MRIKLSAFCVLFLMISLATEASAMPAINQVVKQFFKEYKWDNDNFYLLKFAKKKKGWTVYELDPSQNLKPTKEQLFWSRISRKYKKLRYPKAEGIDTIRYKKYLSSPYADLYNYKRNVYYGYNGYERDIINDFGKRKHLSDTLLESLQRAYSLYAGSELWYSDYEYKKKKSAIKAFRFGDKLPESQLSFFAKYTDKDLETCERLIKQNPDYETKVGNIFAKYSCEFIYAYSTFYMLNNAEAAKKYLPEGLFGDINLSIARNYLKGLPQHTIVFTNTDMGTYPLWYIQEKEGFRRDVNVICITMLQLPVYVNAIRKGFMHQPPLKMDFDSSALVYSSDIYGIDSSKIIDKTGIMLKALADKKEISEYFKIDTAYDSVNNIIIHGNKFIIPVNTVNVWKDRSIGIYNFPFEQRIIYAMTKNKYIFSSDLFILDIISKNDWKKPIYFSMSTDSEDRGSLKNYLIREPFAFHLVPTKMDRKHNINGFENNEGSYNFLLNDVEWTDNDQKIPVNSYSRYKISEAIRMIYYDEAMNYISEDRVKSKALIHKLMNLMPVEKNPGEESLVLIASHAKEFGLNDSFARGLVFNGVKGIKQIAMEELGTESNDQTRSENFKKLKIAQNLADRLRYSDISRDIDQFIKQNGLSKIPEDK